MASSDGVSAREKLALLERKLADLGSALLAYSGGVDSTFLLKVCVGVLGDRVLAVTARSESYPSSEQAEAVELAQQMRARHRIIETREMDNPVFASNPADRCFHCKSELFGQLAEIAREEGLVCVLDGANHDDSGDFRPGARASREYGVRSPLKEAGLTKADIRLLSREMGLPTWNKPSYACLASRIPYGQAITPDKLSQIDAAEEYLHSLGYRQVRVRHHGEVARIEVAPNEVAEFASSPAVGDVVAHVKGLGFLYVTLDLQGYRMGSMNEVLSPQAKQQARSESG